MLPARWKRFEMRVRAMVPDRIRVLYRFGQALSHHEPAKPIPRPLLDSARVCASRADLISMLPQGGTVAELGTQAGHFARVIMARARPSRLHLIDIDFTAFDATSLSSDVVVRHEGLTHAVIATFPAAHFDWIYVDADHSYAGVLRDARAAASVLKPGGYLVFNDFAHIDPYLGRYGVKRAVTDFMIEMGWPMAFLALERNGLYDVALKKPDRA